MWSVEADLTSCQGGYAWNRATSMSLPAPLPSPAAGGHPAASSGGEEQTLEAALPAVYAELRQLAANYLRRERTDHTLQPTALVHEAYLRLTGQRNVRWENRAQFLGVAAQMMRRILANHATSRATAKRGGGVDKLVLDDALEFFERRDLSLEAVEQALRDLESFDPRQGKIVELRFFGGLTIEEVGEVLGVSPATVKREWTIAKLWLYREITGSPPA